MTVELGSAAPTLASLRVRGFAREIARNANLRVGICILAALAALGIVGAVALPDPNHENLYHILAPPGTAGHLLGTDALGRDVFSWVAAGILVSLRVSVTVVAIAAGVGVPVGLLAGYCGGVVDTVLMRIVDLELAIPPLPLFIAASVVLRPGFLVLVCLLAAVAWLPYARLVRSVALVQRQADYIAAARLAGASRRRILFVHLLRGVVTTAVVLASLQAGYVLLWEAGLSFVGLGINPPTSSLGFLMNDGRTTVTQAWWVVVCPGVALALLILAANLIGDGLRDAFQQDIEVFK
jgi:peptide/nickel transport system permease protein